jgi:hypothetical protein
VVLQRAGDMQRDEAGDRVGQERMRERRVRKQRAVRPGDVGNDAEIEEFCRDRQRGGRDEEPAGEDGGERQRVERRLDEGG